MKSSLFFRLKFHYLLVLAGFVVWMLFFDEKDIFTQLGRQQELRTLEKKSEFYRTEIEETRRLLKDLDSDPAKLEQYAREKYFMKRDNEEVFLIPLPGDSNLHR